MNLFHVFVLGMLSVSHVLICRLSIFLGESSRSLTHFYRVVFLLLSCKSYPVCGLSFYSPASLAEQNCPFTDVLLVLHPKTHCQTRAALHL